jgi:hypothetical protein
MRKTAQKSRVQQKKKKGSNYDTCQPLPQKESECHYYHDTILPCSKGIVTIKVTLTCAREREEARVESDDLVSTVLVGAEHVQVRDGRKDHLHRNQQVLIREE